MTKFDFLADPLEKFPFRCYQRENKDEQRNGAPSETRARSKLFCNEKAIQSDLNNFCVSFPLLAVSSRAQNNFFANNDDGRNDSIYVETHFHDSTAARRAWFE